MVSPRDNAMTPNPAAPSAAIATQTRTDRIFFIGLASVSAKLGLRVNYHAVMVYPPGRRVPTITSTPEGVVIDIRVIPRASRSGLAGIRNDALLLRLNAAPVDGAANTEVVDILSDVLGIPRRAVTILAGGRSRLKRVRVEGVSAEFVRARLQAQDPGS